MESTRPASAPGEAQHGCLFPAGISDSTPCGVPRCPPRVCGCPGPGMWAPGSSASSHSSVSVTRRRQTEQALGPTAERPPEPFEGGSGLGRPQPAGARRGRLPDGAGRGRPPPPHGAAPPGSSTCCGPAALRVRAPPTTGLSPSCLDLPLCLACFFHRRRVGQGSLHPCVVNPW